MKKIIFLIFITSCSFRAEHNALDIKYLNVNDFSIGKYDISLDDKIKK